jgi:hypothetical protein
VIDLVQRWIPSPGTWGLQAAIAIGVFLLSAAAGMIVVIGLPPDHFVRAAPVETSRRHPVLRILLVVVKNSLGALLLLLGLVMAVPLVPGPGLVFILLGIGLLDFPGKRSLERRLLRFPHVLASVNSLRSRLGRPPILIE